MRKLLVTLLLGAASVHAVTPAQTMVVAGRVLAESTGQPVRRAYVIVHGPDTRTTRVTMSDLEGEFRFEGLPNDRYRVGASKRPLLSATVDVGEAPVTISLPTGAVVTGAVVDHLGQPISGLEVNISGPALPSPQAVTTNHQGEYRFFSLPPGEYTIGPVRRKGESRIVTVGPADRRHVQALAVEPAAPPVIPERAQRPAGNSVIAGIALDELSKEPLSHATVVSRRSGHHATTDASGRFRFEGLGAGTYPLLIQGGGFLATSGAEVTLSDNAHVVDVTLYGSRNGSIAGTVRDEVGDPVVGMPVVTYHRRILNFQTVLFPRGGGRTDDRGTFDIRNLPHGDYLLCACAGEPLAIDPRLLRQLGPTAPDAATVSRLIDETVQTFAPTYYPGLARSSDSQIVSVESGDDRTGMDITMYGVKPYVVSGQLVDSGGSPATGLEVFLAQNGDVRGAIGVSALAPVEVSPDGRFQFLGVAPGTYSLAATPVTSGHRTPWAHTEITLADGDIENLIVTVGNGLSVTGRVEFSGNAARPSRAALEKTRVGLFPLEFSMAVLEFAGRLGSIGHSATLDASGRFTVDGLPPGRYLVNVSVPDSPWRTIQRLAASGADALDNMLTIDAGGTADILVVMTDLSLATLTGTVQIARDRYESPGFTRAVLFPMDAARWLEPQRYPGQFQRVSPKADGSFRMEHLPPGDYYVARGSSFDAEMSGRSLERWAKTAERVTLRAGQTTSATIK